MINIFNVKRIWKQRGKESNHNKTKKYLYKLEMYLWTFYWNTENVQFKIKF